MSIKCTARTRSQAHDTRLIRRRLLGKNCLDEGDKLTEGVTFVCISHVLCWFYSNENNIMCKKML
jgi:hypothetical protein